MAGQVVPFSRRAEALPEEPPPIADLVAKIHELAKDSSNLHMHHPHFQGRLVSRKISMRQVLDVLRNGSAVGPPRLDDWGDWRVKLRRKTAGRRVQVVVAIKERHLDLVTAI